LQKVISGDDCLRCFESTDEQIEYDAFMNLAVWESLPYEQVSAAMTSMAYKDVQQDWVRDIYKTIFKEQPSIDFKQFQEFVESYHSRHYEELVKEFNAFDLNANGILSAGEISVSLERTGITCVPGIVKEIIQEIKNDPSADSLDGIADYVFLREIIQYRQGFTLKEVDTMSELFNRFDYDQSGRLDLRELESAMLWLGFPSDEENADGHFEPIDMQPMYAEFLTAPDLCLEDFLVVMRRRREHDINKLSQLVHEYACNMGTVTLKAAVIVLRRLGYSTTSADCILEYASSHKVGGEIGDSQFFFDDMFLILQSLRKHEGFLTSEIEGFRKVFNHHDLDLSDAIGSMELGGVLRSMGYRASLEEQVKLMDEVDCDQSGEVDFDEFLKLLRRFREDELHVLERAFSRCKKHGVGTLNGFEIKCLLPALGYCRMSDDQNQVVDAATAKMELDFRQCVDMMTELRNKEREKFQLHHGFTEREEHKWREVFHTFSGNSDLLSGDAFRKLVMSNFEDVMKDEEELEEAHDIMNGFCVRHDNSITLPQTLEAIRMIEDRHFHRTIMKEDEAAVVKGFSREAVRDFRKMFNLFDCDASKNANVDQLLEVFSSIVPMSESLRVELKTILQENQVTAKKSHGKKAEKEHKKLYFTTFVDMMGLVMKNMSSTQRASFLIPEAAAAADNGRVSTPVQRLAKQKSMVRQNSRAS